MGLNLCCVGAVAWNQGRVGRPHELGPTSDWSHIRKKAREGDTNPGSRGTDLIFPNGSLRIAGDRHHTSPLKSAARGTVSNTEEKPTLTMLWSWQSSWCWHLERSNQRARTSLGTRRTFLGFCLWNGAPRDVNEMQGDVEKPKTTVLPYIVRARLRWSRLQCGVGSRSKTSQNHSRWPWASLALLA